MALVLPSMLLLLQCSQCGFPRKGKRGGRRKDGALHIMRHLQKATHRLHTGLPSPSTGFLRLLAELVDALLLARVDDEQIGARGQVAERKHMLRSGLLHGVFHQVTPPRLTTVKVVAAGICPLTVRALPAFATFKAVSSSEVAAWMPSVVLSTAEKRST